MPSAGKGVGSNTIQTAMLDFNHTCGQADHMWWTLQPRAGGVLSALTCAKPAHSTSCAQSNGSLVPGLTMQDARQAGSCTFNQQGLGVPVAANDLLDTTPAQCTNFSKLFQKRGGRMMLILYQKGIAVQCLYGCSSPIATAAKKRNSLMSVHQGPCWDLWCAQLISVYFNLKHRLRARRGA